MGIRIGAGEYFSLLERGTVTVSPGSDPLWPPANLYDRETGAEWQASSNAADAYVQLDLRPILDGRFEGGLTGWTEAVTGTGTTAASATAHGGTGALSCDAGAGPGTAARWKDVVVAAGEKGKFEAWINPGVARTGEIRIQDLQTGKWWVAGAWQSAAGAAFSVANIAAYTVGSTEVEVESIAAHGGHLRPTLRVYCYTVSNGAVLFDDVHYFPGVDHVSAHGHNHTPVVTPQLRYSLDGWGASDVLAATLIPRQPSYYATLAAPVYAPDWRFKLAGTNHATPYICELIIAQTEDPLGSGVSLIRFPERTDSHRAPLISSETESGELTRARLSDEPSRVIRLTCDQYDLAAFRRWVDGLWRRTYSGELPLVLVASTNREDDVVYGYLVSSMESARGPEGGATNEIQIQECGFVVKGATT